MYVYVYVRIEQPRKFEKKHDTHGNANYIAKVHIITCVYVYNILKIKPGVPTKHLAGINTSGNAETKEITPS